MTGLITMSIRVLQRPIFLKTTQGKPGTLFITPIFSILPGVSKKMNDSEIRRFSAHKSLLCLSILNGSFILDAKVCLGTTGNICVSLQCTLGMSLYNFPGNERRQEFFMTQALESD